MRKPQLTLVLAILLAAWCSPVAAVTQRVPSGSDLQAAIDRAQDGDTLVLAVGDFTAAPTSYVDSLCGNCQEARTPVTATVGFVIANKSLVLIGLSRDGTRLVTQAGYGLYIKNSPRTVVRNLTVTGGRRDADGRATDAAVVVRRSEVYITDCDIVGNDHRIDTVIVGVGGVFGREGSQIHLTGCLIANNGWDGVALYRGAGANVMDCLIRDGRGAGIGVTWDATCVAYRNEVTGYWKGIGAFGTSWVVARNNLVHRNLGWGIIATGQSYMDISNNTVFYNGNCGVAPWGTEARGRIVNNVIARNGWRDQWVCPCVGVWNYGDWAKWEFGFNLVWNNAAGNYESIWDQTGFRGNISEDPQFRAWGDYRTDSLSPVFHAGDSTVFNLDGSRSHIGMYGGPQAWPGNRTAFVTPQRADSTAESEAQRSKAHGTSPGRR